MTPHSRVPVWLPLLVVALGIAVMMYTTVVAGMWILAGLVLAEATARGLGWEGFSVRVRRRGIDIAVLATFAILLALLASSGVLD